ncbi:MAG: L-threonylcarbamoyladenylate synthase [Chitinophagales bacterium]
MTSSSDIINTCIEHLRKGHVILYPTDTIWGLGCDPFNQVALEKIFELKNRDTKKSFILIVDSLMMLKKYVENIPEQIHTIIEETTQPLTIIYKASKKLPNYLLAPDGTIAIRIINHSLINPLIKAYGQPIVSTSANISGEVNPTSLEKINPQIISHVKFIVPPEFDTSSHTHASKILKINKDGSLFWIRK